MLSKADYHKKTLGCWMGKNIGGTVGAPFEWRRQVNNIDFYTQDLGGEPMPNDDLDIQLLWLIMLEERGIDLDPSILADYWIHYVTAYWAEYGYAKLNMRTGLQPPYTGIHNNYLKHSCGAFIRSEIWACIAPGRPDIAARYAFNDASIDHGDGEGTFSAVFCAALESAAFVESDINKLIDIGLSYIPEDCGTYKAILCARESHANGLSWVDARHKLLESHRGEAFFRSHDHISQEDKERGFFDGISGWDAPSNIGIIIIGLLYGKGDFGKTICTAVNCGEDTDCTAATLGAIFGIINGIDAIPEKWITPIGRSIKTTCISTADLGYTGFGDFIPQTVDNLTERTTAIMAKVAVAHGLPVEVDPPKPIAVGNLFANKEKMDYLATISQRFTFPYADIAVEYVNGPSITPGAEAVVRLHFSNTYRMGLTLNAKVYMDDNWEVLPTSNFKTFVGAHIDLRKKTIEIKLRVKDSRNSSIGRGVVELTLEGRSHIMLVPLIVVTEI